MKHSNYHARLHPTHLHKQFYKNSNNGAGRRCFFSGALCYFYAAMKSSLQILAMRTTERMHFNLLGALKKSSNKGYQFNQSSIGFTFIQSNPTDALFFLLILRKSTQLNLEKESTDHQNLRFNFILFDF